MRKPQGYATVVGDLRRGDVTIVEQGVRHFEGELDTFTCNHCNRIVHVKPMCDAADVGGLCKQCMGLVCPTCNAKGTCTPWEKKLEQMERRDAIYKAAVA